MANLTEKIISLVIKGKDLFSPESAKSKQALKELREETATTRDELKSLTKTSADVEKAIDLKATLDEQKRAMDDASTALKDYAKSLDDAATEANKNKAELKQLRAEQTKQNKALTRARTALKNHQQSLADGEEETAQFKRRTAQLTEKVEEQKQAVTKAKTAVADMTKTIADAGTTTQQTRVQMKALNSEVSNTTKEYNRTAKELGKTLDSLNKAGVDTKNLADEQSRLAETSEDLTEKLDDLRTSTKRFASDIKLADNLDDQSQAVRRAIDALDDYSRQLNRNGSINDEQARQQQRLTDSAEKMVREYRKGADTLAQHIMTLRAAGEETADLEKEQARLAKTAKVLAERLDDAKGEAAKTNGALASMKNAAKAANSGIDGLTRNLMALGGTYFAIDLVTTTLSKFFQTAGQMEDFRYQLIGVFNDVEKGEAAYDWIVDFTKEVPNKLEDVTQAFIMLHNQGMNPQDGTLKKIIAANAKYGKGVETLIPIIRQLTQSWAKNRIQAEEVYVLVENGIPVWDMLAKVTGKTVGQLQKMSEQGRLTRTELKLLLDEMGNSSMAAMETRMESFNALLAKMGDRINQILDTIARSGSLEYFKNELDELGDTIDKLAANGELQKMAKDVSEAMVNTASAIKSLVVTTYQWADAIKAVAIAAVGLKLFSMFKNLLGVIKPLAPAITTFSTAAVAGMMKIRAVLVPLAAGAVWGVAQIIELGRVTYDLADSIDNLAESEKLKADTEKRAAEILAEYSNQLGIHIGSFDEYNALLSRGTIVVDQLTGKVMLASTYQATLQQRMIDTAHAAEHQLSPAVEKIINDFLSMKDRGDSVNTMLKTLFGGPEQLTSVGHLLDMAIGLREVEKAGILTAEELENGLGSVLEKLSGADLLQFQQQAELAFKSVEAGSINASTVLSTALSAAMDKFSLDVDTVRGEMTDLGHDSVNTLQAIAKNSEASSASLYAASKAAIELAKTEADVRVLVNAIEDFGEAGLLSSDQVKSAMLQASGKVSELTQKTNELEQALSRLGVDSLVGLRASLTQTQADYNALVEAQKRGEATTYQVQQAYLKWADAAFKVAQVSGKQVDSLVVVKGAAMGLNDELMDLVNRYQEAAGNSHTFENSLERVAIVADTTSNAVAGAKQAITEQSAVNDQAAQSNQNLASGMQQAASSGTVLGSVHNALAEQTRSLSEATHQYYLQLAGLPFSEVKSESEQLRAELEAVNAEVLRLGNARLIASSPTMEAILGMAHAAAQAKAEFLKQANALDKLQDKLSDTGNVTQDLIDRASRAAKGFDLLNESDLSGLKSQIKAAQQQMEQMKQSADSTLDSLKGQLAGLNGDIVEQERLQLASQRRQLEAQLAEAKAAKNDEAVRDLQQALRTFDEIERKRMAAARQQKNEQIAAEQQAIRDKEAARQKELADQRAEQEQAAKDAQQKEKERREKANENSEKTDTETVDQVTKPSQTSTNTNPTAPVGLEPDSALKVVEMVKFDISIGNKSSIAYTVPESKNDLFDMLQNLKNISM